MKKRDEKLDAFAELWDGSSPAERATFLRRHAPHIPEALVAEHSKCKAVYLPKGVLLGLVHLFEGEAEAERDESDRT